MDEDTQGFEAHLGTLDEVATSLLPAAASILRAPVDVIVSPESIQGSGRFPAMEAMENAYVAFAGAVGGRQWLGCDRIDVAAQALRDIVRLYRRVDGQG